MQRTPEENREAAARWIRHVDAAGQEDWDRAVRAARRARPAPSGYTWRLGIGLGLALVGIAVWPLGPVAVALITSWHSRTPESPGSLAALAGCAYALALAETGLAVFTAALIIAHHA